MRIDVINWKRTTIWNERLHLHLKGKIICRNWFWLSYSSQTLVPSGMKQIIGFH